MSPKQVDDFPADDGHQLAFVMQKIEDTISARAESVSDFNNRIKSLELLAKRIRQKILTGQMDLIEEELPLEK